MKRKNKVTYLGFIIMILLIGIGYAILTTNLNITGTTVLKDNRWDIHFENVNVVTGSVTASTPTIDQAGTTVSYSVTLDKPGDFFEFTVDAVNDGTIDGMIESISSKLNGTEITTLPNALEYSVTYADGLAIQNNQILVADNSESIRIRIGYKTDIEIEDLPSTEQTLNLLFTIAYIQADNTSQPVPHQRIVYTVQLFDYDNQENTVVQIGQPIPNTITQYQTPDTFINNNNTNSIDTFFKHILVNNTVTESYIIFHINEYLSQTSSEFVPGIYTLRIGGASYNSSTSSYNNDSPYYEANKQVLQQAFNNSICTDYDTYYRCTYNNPSHYLWKDARVSADGSVALRDDYGYAYGTSNGESYLDFVD